MHALVFRGDYPPRLLKLTESPHNLRFTTPFIISTSTKVP